MKTRVNLIKDPRFESLSTDSGVSVDGGTLRLPFGHDRRIDIGEVLEPGVTYRLGCRIRQLGDWTGPDAQSPVWMHPDDWVPSIDLWESGEGISWKTITTGERKPFRIELRSYGDGVEISDLILERMDTFDPSVPYFHGDLAPLPD